MGIPPETIKDCIKQDISIPNIYIIPTKRYDNRHYVSVAEFEFPAYFNFFVTKKQITLICTKEAEHALRTVFQETLLGPVNLDGFEKEFASTLPKSYIPDMRKELDYFAINPFTKEKLSIDSLVKFINYDDNMEVKLGSGGN